MSFVRESNKKMLNDALFSSQKSNWCTPQEVIDPILLLGEIALDPCSNENSIVPAKRSVCLPENGLEIDWPEAKLGITYVNPPYGNQTELWMKKAVHEHKHRNSEVILLVPARPDTKLWQDVVFPHASAICFWRGRLKFLGAPNGAPFPSAVVYLGTRMFSFEASFCTKGYTLVT